MNLCLWLTILRLVHLAQPSATVDEPGLCLRADTNCDLQAVFANEPLTVTRQHLILDTIQLTDDGSVTKDSEPLADSDTTLDSPLEPPDDGPGTALNVTFEADTVDGTVNDLIPVNDTDPTEDCRFMSFEEWKKQKNLNSSTLQNITNSSVPVAPRVPLANTTLDDQGKTYKDKFNYASVDCAATVVKTNNFAKGALSILNEHKDSYLLNQCSSPSKFVVIELCEDILVEDVVVANYEFFSSMFKTIRVSVSDRFPVGPQGWRELGEFEAQNLRDVQHFNIDNPLIWARYLRLDILSHYGTEFYCPISVVRVHGRTMMDDVKMIEEVPEPAETNSTGLVLDLEDECKAVLPHLRLNEFLDEHNICAVNTSAPTPTPKTGTQESIYKNIMKRLTLLESNASLSLLYIEEQSKLLSSAFTSLERSQSSKFDVLVDAFNKSMVHQLGIFRQSFLSIQHEALTFLRQQQSSHRSLLGSSNDKLSRLASDLQFFKRITFFNTLLILCLLTYILITREVYVAPPAPRTRRRRKEFPVGFSRYQR